MYIYGREDNVLIVNKPVVIIDMGCKLAGGSDEVDEHGLKEFGGASEWVLLLVAGVVKAQY